MHTLWPSQLLGHAFLSRPKNKNLKATYEENAFQLSLLSQKDPLTLPTFPIFNFHCVPHCGVYGDDYTPCLPLVLVELPVVPSALEDQLPESVLKALRSTEDDGEDSSVWDSKIDFFVIFHSKPNPSVCQKFLCNNYDEVNLMYHAWLFSGIELNSETTISYQLEMGLFDAVGVEPVHLDLKDSGISFDELSPRTVAVHGFRFSPENAMFRWKKDFKIASFFSVGKALDKLVFVFHVLPADDDAEKRLKGVVAKSGNLLELVDNLAVVDQISAVKFRDVLMPLLR